MNNGKDILLIALPPLNLVQGIHPLLPILWLSNKAQSCELPRKLRDLIKPPALVLGLTLPLLQSSLWPLTIHSLLFRQCSDFFHVLSFWLEFDIALG